MLLYLNESPQVLTGKYNFLAKSSMEDPEGKVCVFVNFPGSVSCSPQQGQDIGLDAPFLISWEHIV